MHSGNMETLEDYLRSRSLAGSASLAHGGEEEKKEAHKDAVLDDRASATADMSRESEPALPGREEQAVEYAPSFPRASVLLNDEQGEAAGSSELLEVVSLLHAYCTSERVRLESGLKYNEFSFVLRRLDVLGKHSRVESVLECIAKIDEITKMVRHPRLDGMRQYFRSFTLWGEAEEVPAAEPDSRKSFAGLLSSKLKSGETLAQWRDKYKPLEFAKNLDVEIMKMQHFIAAIDERVDYIAGFYARYGEPVPGEFVRTTKCRNDPVFGIVGEHREAFQALFQSCKDALEVAVALKTSVATQQEFDGLVQAMHDAMIALSTDAHVKATEQWRTLPEKYDNLILDFMIYEINDYLNKEVALITSETPRHEKLVTLKKLHGELFEIDQAGLKALEQLITLVESLQAQAQIKPADEGSDPNERFAELMAKPFLGKKFVNHWADSKTLIKKYRLPSPPPSPKFKPKDEAYDYMMHSYLDQSVVVYGGRDLIRRLGLANIYICHNQVEIGRDNVAIPSPGLEQELLAATTPLVGIPVNTGGHWCAMIWNRLNNEVYFHNSLLLTGAMSFSDARSQALTDALLTVLPPLPGKDDKYNAMTLARSDRQYLSSCGAWFIYCCVVVAQKLARQPAEASAAIIAQINMTASADRVNALYNQLLIRQRERYISIFQVGAQHEDVGLSTVMDGLETAAGWNASAGRKQLEKACVRLAGEFQGIHPCNEKTRSTVEMVMQSLYKQYPQQEPLAGEPLARMEQSITNAFRALSQLIAGKPPTAHAPAGAMMPSLAGPAHALAEPSVPAPQQALSRSQSFSKQPARKLQRRLSY